ncbi:GspH/FimT family pseudopilin [Vibrio rotiferianus]|uniref:GspH/FimT family pseudopilin n=1 Tax=Vibrio rotiferianus TaxID=190895 RepID=UPI00406A8CC9
MHRGFTLLELIISLAVFGIVAAVAAPNLHGLLETSKMQRLAKELHGFVLEAKSEAVLRRERLWIHIYMVGASDSTGNWWLELTDNIDPNLGNKLLTLSGKPYDGIFITSNYNSSQISFDSIHGRPASGHFRFHPVNNTNKELKLISFTRSARFKMCSNSQTDQYFGYVGC